jgi:hypothetical protein
MNDTVGRPPMKDDRFVDRMLALVDRIRTAFGFMPRRRRRSADERRARSRSAENASDNWRRLGEPSSEGEDIRRGYREGRW